MAAMAKAPPPEDTTAKARRVLVDDDDGDFADSIAMLLKTRGYSDAVANDDRRAQAAAEGFAPEIALIDIQLGRASGIGLVRALRGRWPELICVIVTALAEVDAALAQRRPPCQPCPPAMIDGGSGPIGPLPRRPS